MKNKSSSNPLHRKENVWSELVQFYGGNSKTEKKQKGGVKGRRKKSREWTAADVQEVDESG